MKKASARVLSVGLQGCRAGRVKWRAVGFIKRELRILGDGRCVREKID